MKKILLILILLSVLPCAAKKKKTSTEPQRSTISVPDARRLSYYYAEANKQRLAGNLTAAYDLYQYCLGIDPLSSEALYWSGYMKFYLHQDSLGTELIRQAAELDPKNPWYKETLAAAYINAEQNDKAIPVMEQLSQLQTKRTDILYQLVDMYKDNKKTNDAIAVLNRIETLEGKSLQTSFSKYQLYMSQGKRKPAFAELASLEKEFPYDMRIPIVRGQAYMKDGQEQKALECYNHVRQSDPNNTALQMVMLDYYEQKGQDSVRAAYRDSLLYSPTISDELRLSLVSTLMDDLKEHPDQNTQMLATLDSLTKLSPTSEVYSLRAAYMMYVKASEDSVAQALQDVLKVDPSNDMALNRLLPYYLGQQDFDHAIEVCRKGINSKPENLAYHFYLGVSLYQEKRLDEAIEAFQNGVHQINENSSPDIVADLYSVLGDCYHEQGRNDEAYAAYDSCLVYQEDNASCLNNYAYYLSLEEDKLEKAEEMAYRAIKLEPLNKTYLDTYAWVLFKRGNTSMAKFYIDRVVSPSADDETLLKDENLSSEVLQHAADIYTASNLPEQAQHYHNLAQQKKE